MVGKKGDTNGLQGANGTELNTVTEMNCVTLAGQPQEEHISRSILLWTFIKIKSKPANPAVRKIQVRQRPPESRALPRHTTMAKLTRTPQLDGLATGAFL